jgi:hypothetical protein
MSRFVIAFGHTIYSFGLRPLVRRTWSDDFVVLFGPDRQQSW